jgi:hypothetical protein
MATADGKTGYPAISFYAGFTLLKGCVLALLLALFLR